MQNKEVFIIFSEIHLTLSFVFLLWFCNVYYDFQLQMAFMSSLECITDVIYDKMERHNATISILQFYAWEKGVLYKIYLRVSVYYNFSEHCMTT
jgi:hypothetical protein